MKPIKHIETMYAFIVVGQANNTEGIAAIGLGDMVVPLVGADLERVTALKELVKIDKRFRGQRIVLAHFTNRTDVEVIQE